MASICISLRAELMQAATGTVSEYGRIEETMSPLVLDAVAEWILAVAGNN